MASASRQNVHCNVVVSRWEAFNRLLDALLRCDAVVNLPQFRAFLDVDAHTPRVRTVVVGARLAATRSRARART